MSQPAAVVSGLMNSSELKSRLLGLDPASEAYATEFVNQLLVEAQGVQTSDVHLQPHPDGLIILWRMDGVLQPLGTFPPGDATRVISRLKVLAELLTYRSDLPQEGRIREGASAIEMRVSTFPTLHGERAVVRFFASQDQYRFLDQLCLPDDIPTRLSQLLAETNGALMIAGPAGSGKTTTTYACLRELVRATSGGRSIVSLEDPIEVAVDGVAQSQVNPAVSFDLTTGLKSLLRQDPEVILVGEIRDKQTAEVCTQASLTGQLVLTTFHAGTAAGAIGRLLDMGIEPYLLRSGVLAIVCQRLVRRLCCCSREISDPLDLLGLPVAQARAPVGCSRCHGTGFDGRRVLAELLEVNAQAVGEAILNRYEVSQINRLAVESGMIPLWNRALVAVEAGWTSPAEVRRVLGFRLDAGLE